MQTLVHDVCWVIRSMTSQHITVLVFKEYKMTVIFSQSDYSRFSFWAVSKSYKQLVDSIPLIFELCRKNMHGRTPPVPWIINLSVNIWCMFLVSCFFRNCYMPKRSVMVGLGTQGPVRASWADGAGVTSYRKTKGQYYSDYASERDRGVRLLNLLQTQ